MHLFKVKCKMKMEDSKSLCFYYYSVILYSSLKKLGISTLWEIRFVHNLKAVLYKVKNSGPLFPVCNEELELF